MEAGGWDGLMGQGMLRDRGGFHMANTIERVLEGGNQGPRQEPSP